MDQGGVVWPEGRLTLVVPIHGKIETTLEFLDSYERQTVKAPLLFIDDRSPDDSVSILREKGYTVLVPDKRLWFNGALNLSIAECGTTYLGFLNNDIVFGSTFVEDILHAIETSNADFLVPKSVDLKEHDYLDAKREYDVGPLNRREGWAMFFRVEKTRMIPRIPIELRLWFGDDWLFHHAVKMEQEVLQARHVRVYHVESTKSAVANAVIAKDQEIARLEYWWMTSAIDRPRIEKKVFSLDPASRTPIPVYIQGNEDSSACDAEGWLVLSKGEPKSFGSVVVVVPKSSLHARFEERFVRVVNEAWSYSHGPFSSMKIEFVEDTEYRGAGWGRNLGVERNPEADWYFFVDVDDLPKPWCFEAMNRATSDVVWGVIEHRKRIGEEVAMFVNSRAFLPYSWDLLVSRGHDDKSGLNNAFFIKGDLARAHRWFEGEYALEDIEYFIVVTAHSSYERLPFPLVTIDQISPKPNAPRAGGDAATWFRMQTFWKRYGRQGFEDYVVQARNQAKSFAEFYG